MKLPDMDKMLENIWKLVPIILILGLIASMTSEIIVEIINNFSKP